MVRGSSRLAAAAAAAPAPAPSRKRGAAANAEPANAPAAGPSGSSPSKRAAAQEEPPKRRKTAKGGHFVRTRRFEPTCFAGAVPHEPLKLQNLEEGEIYIMYVSRYFCGSSRV